MRVALISTYELGRQPVHLASPAASLRAAGHEVRTLDLAVEQWDDDLVGWAGAVAFSTPMHTALRLATAAANRIKARRNDIPLAVYGLYAAVARTETPFNRGDSRGVRRRTLGVGQIGRGRHSINRDHRVQGPFHVPPARPVRSARARTVRAAGTQHEADPGGVGRGKPRMYAQVPTLPLPTVYNGSGPNADDLEIVSPAALDSSLPPRLPILRHGTMAGFMDNTPGKKKRALLSALGLAELLEFRDTLVTAAGAANRTANDAKEQATGELSALGDECAGASVIQQAEAHRVDAGLGQPITTETDLLSLDLARTPAVETRVNRAELVEKVARNAEAINAAAIDGWNKIVKSREAAEGAALHDLVSAGQKVLESWGEDVCPLCLKPDDRSRLSASLAERAVSLAKLDERFRSARSHLRTSATILPHSPTRSRRFSAHRQWGAGLTPTCSDKPRRGSRNTPTRQRLRSLTTRSALPLKT